LERAGHDVIAVDLPVDDDNARFTDYADVVVDAIGDRRGVILVAQSLGGFTAPIVASRVPVEAIILVNAMVPKSGESAGEWWDATDQPNAMREEAVRNGRNPGDDLMQDPDYLFLHDVPPDVVRGSANHLRRQSGTPFTDPWPLESWPDVPTRFLLGRQDRLFPADFLRRVVRDRLSITPDEIEGGHLVALSCPKEVAAFLLDRADDRR
jgi:pimeloyl-ACP methyl ester carboxylesterase